MTPNKRKELQHTEDRRLFSAIKRYRVKIKSGGHTAETKLILDKLDGIYELLHRRV